jgi:hypothetical protein
MLWILFSDSMLSWISRDSALWQLAHIHILKGIFFVAVTGAALFYFVHDLYQRLVTKDTYAANLFEHNPNPLVILDPKSLTVAQMNDAALSLLELDKLSPAERNLSEFVDESQRDRFKNEMLCERTSLQFRDAGTWDMQTHTGKILAVRMNAANLVKAKGSQLILSFYNLTPQVTAERQLKEFTQFFEHKITQRTAQLERLNEELTFRAKETEKVNSELIFINEKLQSISRERIETRVDVGPLPLPAGNSESL